jgi:hypothetical protein
MTTEILENKKTEQIKIPPCEKCGGTDHWLPRMPGVTVEDVDEWRCWTCRRPSSPNIVSKRVGPLAEAIRLQRLADNPDPDSVRTLAFGAAVCSICGCHWVSEHLYSGSQRCHCCKLPIYPFEIANAIAAEKNLKVKK